MSIDLDDLLVLDEATREQLEREAGLDRLEELGATLMQSWRRFERDYERLDDDE